MISILLWILASLLNAGMDILRFRFATSVFRNLNPKFWDPNVSYKHAYVIPFTGYKVDAWHLLKSAMIIAIILSMAFLDGYMAWYWMLLVYGIFWNGCFGIAYHLMTHNEK